MKKKLDRPIWDLEKVRDEGRAVDEFWHIKNERWQRKPGFKAKTTKEERRATHNKSRKRRKEGMDNGTHRPTKSYSKSKAWYADAQDAVLLLKRYAALFGEGHEATFRDLGEEPDENWTGVRARAAKRLGDMIAKNPAPAK